MLLARLRPWLAFATVVVLASCDLNPQPDLPARQSNDDPQPEPGPGAAGSLNLGSGGTSPSDLPGLPQGNGGSSDSAPQAGQNAGGQAGDDGAGGQAGDDGAGGQSVGGEAGANTAGQGSRNAADAGAGALQLP